MTVPEHPNTQALEHFLRLRLREKIRETPRAVTLVLEPVDGPVTYRAGQFLTFIFRNLGATEVRRSYSLSSASGVDEHLAVTVQKVPNGSVSRYLVDEVGVGEAFTALAPAGRFTLTPADGPRDIVLIGGGSGVTPLFSLAKAALHAGGGQQVTLIDANRDETSVLFRESLRRLAAGFPDRFRGYVYLSEPRAPLPELRESLAPLAARRGRLSNALIEQLVAENLRHDPARAEFFLCGPAGLLIKAENTLGYMGFPAERVHREVFTVKTPYRPPAAIYPDSRITLRRDGDTHHFPLRGGQTILEAAQAAGLSLPYSCRSGVCTTCSVRCLSGKVDMYTQDGRLDSGSARGLVLTCVGYPATEELVISIQ